MCGIWAFLSKDDIDSNMYSSYYHSTAGLRNRGPDKTTMVMHSKMMMIFDRLGFHDLSPLGDQPFVFNQGDTKYYLMVNGEIYNHQDLIKKYNLPVRSQNDCEVVYHLWKFFQEDTTQLLNELNGEFAFLLLTENPKNGWKLVAGRDPYGVRPLFYGFDIHGNMFFSSLVIGLTPFCNEIHVFPVGSIMEGIFPDFKITPYFSFTPGQSLSYEKLFVYRTLTDLLIQAVEKRLDSERPMGCLLSGGLDSSLVCGIICQILHRKDEIETFTTGLEGGQGTDFQYAQEVANFLKVKNHFVPFTEHEGIDNISSTILACETWDITTIRASVAQFILAEYISKKTSIKTILNGDGADELEMGYLYWYQAPDDQSAHEESLNRLKEIHLYDGLRVDRCLGYHGLEGRFPFLDKDFTSFFLKIPVEYRRPTPERMEKFLIRDAFETLYPNILPKSVLWRKKEAFSDGVSSLQKSWYQMIQEWMEKNVQEEEVVDLGFPEKPVSKESFYYQKKFTEYFGSSSSTVIPRYWLPRWNDNLKEPSARVLGDYNA